MEQTLNRDCKTSGGLTGITLNSNAVQKWILSQSERAVITRQCEKKAGFHVDTRTRKDLDHTRRRRDETNVRKVMECFEQ